MKLGLIGKGPWAMNIKRTLEGLGETDVHQVGRDEGWRAAFVGSPEAILCAAHPSIHSHVAAMADARRLPLWLEKPAALNLREVLGMAVLTTPIFVDYTYLFQGRGASHKEVLAGMGSGRAHDYGIVYDWFPHVLSLTYGPALDVDETRPPLENALRSFLAVARDGAALPYPFELTVDIHRRLARLGERA